MEIEKVIELLNTGKSLEEVAVIIGIDVRDLKRKLVNAAVEFDNEKKQYEYKGVAPEQSLSRDIKKKIMVLLVDKPFVIKENNKNQNNSKKETNDMEYLMFKDYQKVDQSLLTEKKTFFLAEEMYCTIKHLSIEKRFRINALINVLLAKGLEHYKIDLKKNK